MSAALAYAECLTSLSSWKINSQNNNLMCPCSSTNVPVYQTDRSSQDSPEPLWDYSLCLWSSGPQLSQITEVKICWVCLYCDAPFTQVRKNKCAHSLKCLTRQEGLTCSWRGAFVTARAPGFAHAAAAQLFTQLGRNRVQTLPPWADQTEASTLLLLDGRRIGWRGAQEVHREEEEGGGGSGAPENRRHIHVGKRGQRVEK